MRTCKVCCVTKTVDSFYPCGKNKEGVLRYALTCISCTKVKSKVYYELKYSSTLAKAKDLLKNSKQKNKEGREFDIDLDFLVEKLDKGVCEVTGIAFSYERKRSGSTNKFAPSVDRLDSNLGYTKDNVRVVIWWYNLMKNDETDEATLAFCQAVVKNLTSQNAVQAIS